MLNLEVIDLSQNIMWALIDLIKINFYVRLCIKLVTSGQESGG